MDNIQKKLIQKNDILLSKKLEKLLFIALFIFIGLFFYHKIFFINADLGRHIKNGETFFEQGFPISTNYYSYTEPDFPTINHHWGAGVIFYLIWKWFGFEGLSLLNICIYLSTCYIFFKIAVKKSNFIYAYLCLVLSIPLLTNRIEIRPEGFSLLLMGIYFYYLHLFKSKIISFKKTCVILLPLQLLWVNLHLFFIMGPFLIGLFWLNSLINKEDKIILKQYLVLLLSTIPISLLNPSHIFGLLEPFMILREYGYMIAENQSLFFMQKRFPNNPLYIHFEFLLFILIFSFTLLFFKNKRLYLKYFTQIILMFFLSFLSIKVIRGIPLWGLFFIPVFSENIYELEKKYLKPKGKIKGNQSAIIFSILLLFFGLFSKNSYYSPFKGSLGLGLIDNINLSAKYFLDNDIKGKVFNNYDIGGFLIFNLFPKHRVFVDNRPEAYSVSFFKEIYDPMQHDKNIWSEIDKKYNFNCIYFYRHDNTPHAQPFLIERIKDMMWAPVFVDNYTLILLKRNEQNKNLIKLYEIPASIFNVR